MATQSKTWPFKLTMSVDYSQKQCVTVQTSLKNPTSFLTRAGELYVLLLLPTAKIHILSFREISIIASSFPATEILQLLSPSKLIFHKSTSRQSITASEIKIGTK